MNAIVSALRFLFIHTLNRPDLARRLVRLNQPRTLPDVLSADEVRRTAAAIAAIPGGTTHCAQIDVLGPDRFAATILQKSPTGEVATWSLTVATAAQADGTVLITSITPRAEGQP